MSQKEATKLVPEQQVRFWDTTRGKSLKTFLWTTATSVIVMTLNAIVSYLTDNPDMLGVTGTGLVTFVITNVLLVGLKNFADSEVKN